MFNSILDLLLFFLISLGYWKIFNKCGIKSFWAFIPFAREYHISLCADRELEGRVYTIHSAIAYVILSLSHIIKNEMAVALLTIVLLAVYISRYVYQIRIYLGLIKVFERKKNFIWLLVIFEVPALLYLGFSKKCMPNKKFIDYRKLDGAMVSGVETEDTDSGLSVNINERTTFEFFKKIILLKDIHMTIPRGRMVLLLGGSGAGKTTFVNAVTGYEKADATVKLDGNDIYEEYSKMIYDVGFVPQQDLMRDNDTVLLTLSDAASLRLPSSVGFIEINERINHVLEEFGLESVKNSLVEKLSGGQRKRLSIAMEYISDPLLFILDEPDSGLDGVVARSIFEKLRAIADEGKIVIVISHTPDRVADLFDDLIVLAKDRTRAGRLAWYGPLKEAYEFFGADSLEDVLLTINQKEEGGQGRADEFVEEYAKRIIEKVG